MRRACGHREVSRLRIPKAPVGRRAEPRDILLNRRFADLLPPPADGTRRLTEENLVRDGCREPLIVWRRENLRILLIGYDLFPFLKLHRVPFRIIEKSFASFEAASKFVVQYYLERNRLTPLQASYLRGLRYHDDKQWHGGDRRSADVQAASSNRQNGNLKMIPAPADGAVTARSGGPAGNKALLIRQNGILKWGPGMHSVLHGSPDRVPGNFKTATALAEVFHVSPRTIHRDGALARAVQHIAANCGGIDARDLLLKPGTGLTHGRILAWAGLSPEEQKARLLMMQVKGKWTRDQKSADEPRTITLPRPLPAMAQAALDRLGPEKSAQLLHALKNLLEGAEVDEGIRRRQRA